MDKIRITKEFFFEMAHVLDNHQGLCKNIHGHSYKFDVTIIGEPIKKQGDDCNGMVIDFGLLKKIVNDNIIQNFDHTLVLSRDSIFLANNYFDKANTRIVIVDFQPTCENLLLHFVEILNLKFPKNVILFSLLLRETPSSYAEWYAADN